MGACRRGAAGAAAVCVALCLTACGSSQSASSSATIPPAAPTTTRPADPYAVPATIDAAYLNRVLQALERVNGDAVRLIVGSRKLIPDAALRLRAIYSEDDFQTHVNDLLDLLNHGLNDLKASPGDLATTVRRVVSRRPGCLFVEVARDYTAVSRQPKGSAVEFLSVRPADKSRDSGAFNPTPWIIAGEGFNNDGSTPADPCAA